ncbi:hypothetical protein [Flagellimonas sp. HSM57]|uniref:hypothetical protein n=2 Tax=unclassified Flagellimonas TaxID=2644544 RepID=UPI0013D860FA|nr:hypothetical protein [Flagellimonas sp. HSM57]
MKKLLVLSSILLVVLSCGEKKNDVVRKDLMKEIRKYIIFCENRADKSKIASETNIYYVKFYSKNNNDIVDIFQNMSYNKKYMDGYINLKENTVFFYNSDTNLVNVKKLNKKALNDLPDENSKEAELGFNPIVWGYIIKNDSLVKIDSE